MRHLFGVVLAVLLAAGVFFGAAWGYMFLNHGLEASIAANGNSPSAGGALPAGGGSLFQNMHVMAGGGALLGVGLAAGLLLVIPWVSPLAPGLPGLVLVGWTALYVVNVREAVRLIPLKNDDFGLGFESLLFAGLLGAAGLAMIAPLFIPSRWRRPARVHGDASPGESTLGRPFTSARGTASPDPFPTIPGFMMPSGRDGHEPPGFEQTRPQQSPFMKPGGSRPPWELPDQDLQLRGSAGAGSSPVTVFLTGSRVAPARRHNRHSRCRTGGRCPGQG